MIKGIKLPSIGRKTYIVGAVVTVAAVAGALAMSAGQAGSYSGPIQAQVADFDGNGTSDVVYARPRLFGNGGELVIMYTPQPGANISKKEEKALPAWGRLEKLAGISVPPDLNQDKMLDLSVTVTDKQGQQIVYGFINYGMGNFSVRFPALIPAAGNPTK